jgi:threonine-phosphate decarboxylase
MLKGHGDDRYMYNKEIVADFSSNVFYNGMSAGVKKHLADCLNKINNYPEVKAESLQCKLAEWHSLHPEQILVTNGATEAFYLIAHAFRNKSATIVVPAFSEYEDACVANDMKVYFLNWEALTYTTEFKTDIVFLGNPNNPTGSILAVKVLDSLLEKHPQTCFVVDEAYVDFTNKDISILGSINKYKNCIVVKSLTKAYSIPGLRLGYVLSNQATIDTILPYKMPWSVNTLAIEAGMYIAENKHALALPLDTLLEDTKTLMDQLKQIENITVFDSSTNFFLCKTEKGAAAELKQFLVQEYAVLIRDASNFRSLSNQHFRIATQKSIHNKIVVKGVRAWLNTF